MVVRASRHEGRTLPYALRPTECVTLRYEVFFTAQLLSLQHVEPAQAVPSACFIAQVCVPSAVVVQQFASLQQAFSALQQSASAFLQQSAFSLQQLFSALTHECAGSSASSGTGAVANAMKLIRMTIER